jgi:hypothetical protein
MRLALATAGNMLWEVIQPLEGPSIYQDFLAAHGEGVHHVAFGCESLPYAERIKAFESRGCKMIQSGVLGNVPFAYFETEGLISTTVEIYDLVRRAKARSFSGCEPRPAIVAPAGSNRSSRGGNETAEAFGVEGS